MLRSNRFWLITSEGPFLVSGFGFRVFFQECKVGRGELPEVFTAEAPRSQRKKRQVVFEMESRGVKKESPA
jgi:hypothetical protein